VSPIIGIPIGCTRESPSWLGLPAAYCEALIAADGTPVFVPPMSESHLETAFTYLDGLLLAGGGDIDPSEYGEDDEGHCVFVDRPRDALEIGLARFALVHGKPILGICRGIQSLNVAAGGTLTQDIPTAYPHARAHRTDPGLPLWTLAHTVRIAGGSRLARIYGTPKNSGSDLNIRVNSRHHQAVKEMAPGFCASAIATDGIVEAIELSAPGTGFAIGVQWHPENLAPKDPATRRLFRAFVRACDQRKESDRPSGGSV